MKLHALILAMALGSSAASAQDANITIWPKGVPPAGTKTTDFGTHTLQISHREVNGRVEVHQTKADIMVIQSGSATLETGGEVVDPVSTGPNEIQGSSIKGGNRHEIGPGDVIEIPPGVPHQFFVTPGNQITYLVLKVLKK